MLKCIFLLVLIVLSQTIKISSEGQIEPSVTQRVIQNSNHAPQTMLIRESTTYLGDYIFTHYKLVKQAGSQFYQVPDTAEISFETQTRLSRGKATIIFDPSLSKYATAHVHDLEVTKEHRNVINTLHDYLKEQFQVIKVVWHVPETNKAVYDVCKAFNYEIYTKSLTEEKLSNQTAIVP